jgi:hypothetical protein
LAGRLIHHFKLNNAIYKYIPLCPKNPVFWKKKQKKVKKAPRGGVLAHARPGEGEFHPAYYR